MTKGKRLMRDLAVISARRLQNTHTAPAYMEFRFELMREAYGDARVKEDFKTWCDEHVGEGIRWPLIEYMKVIDSRLGGAPEVVRVDAKDPRVKVVNTFCYETTGELPSVTAVWNLLQEFSPEEINAALKEYAEPLTEKEVKSGVKKFFSEGGAVAVILARRKRNQ